MNCHANKSIECTVQQCANHCEGENYCSLDRILVGTHEACPTVDQCTDCMSLFRGSESCRDISYVFPLTKSRKNCKIQISFTCRYIFLHM